MFKFSNTSLNRLNTCDERLQEVFKLALSKSDIDFGISQGHRSVEEQQELYKQGRTKPGSIVTYIDGISDKSEHNHYPSRAVDIYAWIGEASWDKNHLCYLAGIIMASAKELGIKLRWGGNWDQDGIIIKDHEFIDLPHFELDE